MQFNFGFGTLNVLVVSVLRVIAVHLHTLISHWSIFGGYVN